MNQSHNTNTPKIVGSIIVSAVLIIGIYTLMIKKTSATSLASSSPTQTTQTTTPAQSVVANQPQSTATSATSSTYKDGTYTKTMSYRVPGGGVNQLTAKIDVKAGTIAGVTATSQYDERESRMYVTGFDSGISRVVTGQKLGDGYVGRVGGASLTSSAFNDILDAVMKDAKA